MVKTARGAPGTYTHCHTHGGCPWDGRYCTNKYGQCGIKETDAERVCGEWDKCAMVMCRSDYGGYCLARSGIDKSSRQGHMWSYQKVCESTPTPSPTPATPSPTANPTPSPTSYPTPAPTPSPTISLDEVKGIKQCCAKNVPIDVLLPSLTCNDVRGKTDEALTSHIHGLSMTIPQVVGVNVYKLQV